MVSVAGKVITAAATLGILGCKNPKVKETRPQALTEQKNQGTDGTIFGTLKNSAVSFVDSNGQEVNLDAVQAKIGNRFSTVSFVFAACPIVCPTTIDALKRVSENDSSIVHLLISVDPKHDAQLLDDGKTNLETRIANISQGKLRTRGPKPNCIVLYPIGKGTDLAEKLANGESAAYSAQDQFETLFRGADAPEGHTATVMLFGNNQKKVTQITPKANTEPSQKALEIANGILGAITQYQEHGPTH